MKLIVAVICVVALVVAAVCALLGAVLAEFPWIAGPAAMGGQAQVQQDGTTTIRLNVDGLPPVDQWPAIMPVQVPADQAPLIVAAAEGSTCGVTAADLTAIAQTESNFGKNLLNPVSGAFGYGQFDTATWATYGSGNPNNPADALPAIARTLCGRGYATNRVAALNSYGGCVTANCLGAGSYADQINQLDASYGVTTSDVVTNARTWLGVPYSFGGCTRAGVDCSCLTMLAYQAVGVRLPRTAQQQWDSTPRIDRSALQPGDEVFFANTYQSADRITHVGIYEGNGIMINAPDAGGVVSEMPVFSGFWGSHFAGAGRPRR